MNTKHILNSAVEYVLPGDCFEQFMHFNFFHRNCAQLFVSRLLGIGITLGSSFLLLPQILKINNAKSGQGISLTAQFLGLLSAAGIAAYSYEKKFIFGQWGDSLFVALQTMFIIMQILYFSNSKANAFAFGSFCWTVFLAVIWHFIPMRILELLQFATVPITFLSKGIQIWTNTNQGSTGQLSVISVNLQFLGCLARVFTSIQETDGDWLVIAPFIVASLLNGIILGQILFYSWTKKATTKVSKKKQ